MKTAVVDKKAGCPVFRRCNKDRGYSIHLGRLNYLELEHPGEFGFFHASCSCPFTVQSTVDWSYVRIDDFNAVFRSFYELKVAIPPVLKFIRHGLEFLTEDIELFSNFDLFLLVMLQRIIILLPCVIVVFSGGISGYHDRCNNEGISFCGYQRILNVKNTSRGVGNDRHFHVIFNNTSAAW